MLWTPAPLVPRCGLNHEHSVSMMATWSQPSPENAPAATAHLSFGGTQPGSRERSAFCFARQMAFGTDME
jgi:hypothetical protein